MRRNKKTPDHRITMLRNVPTFAGHDDRELAALAPLFDIAHIPAGYVLIHEGETAREAFVIVEGEAHVSCKGKHVATLSAGDYVGELGLLDQMPRTATVTATGPMALLAVSQKHFGDLVRLPGVAETMARTLATRLRSTQDVASA